MTIMAGTFSDWIIGMKNVKGLEALALSFDSDKVKDMKRLRNSGLPVFDDFSIPLAEFNLSNEHLKGFMSKYHGFVVRAIPNTKSLPRRYKIGVHSFGECEDFLSKVVSKEDRHLYSVILTELEPTKKSGVIICRGEGEALIEISGGGLDKFSHGALNPRAVGEMHFGRMRYFRYANEGHPKEIMASDNPKDMDQRALIWRAFKCLKSALIYPLPGYFEFVVTETDKIRFVDFKTPEGYLK